MSIEILRDTLHALLCDLPHEDNMLTMIGERSECKCYYYLEKSLTQSEELPDHVYWADQCVQLMELLHTNQPSNVLTTIYKVLSIIEKVNQLSADERSLFELFYKPQKDDESDQYCIE